MTLMTRLCGEGDMASVSQTPVYSNCPRLPSLNFPTFTRETVTVTSNLSYIPHRLLYYWQPDPRLARTAPLSSSSSLRGYSALYRRGCAADAKSPRARAISAGVPPSGAASFAKLAVRPIESHEQASRRPALLHPPRESSFPACARRRHHDGFWEGERPAVQNNVRCAAGAEARRRNARR